MGALRGVIAAFAVAAALGAAACGDLSSSDPPETLDELVEQVAEIRGLGAPEDFEVLYLPRSEVPDLLDELITPADRALFADTTALYRLLGYIENDEDYLNVYRAFGADAILGLYAPDRDTLWVVHRDDVTGAFDELSRAQVETLAHEVVHALQDHHFKLDEDYYEIGADLDRALAWTAIIEGDATLHDEEFSDEYLAVPLGAGGPVMLLADGAQIGRAAVSSAVVRELYFPYTRGTEAVAWIVDKLSIETVNGFLAEPPRGTTLIIHPERIKDGWTPREVSLPDLTGALGDGWERDSGGTFGEFHLANYLQQERHPEDAFRAADGWAGDHYDVYRDGDETVAVFRVTFADRGEAAQFRREHDEFAEEAAARRTAERDGFLVTPLKDGDVLVRYDSDGDEALFVIGSDEEAAVRALQALARG